MVVFQQNLNLTFSHLLIQPNLVIWFSRRKNIPERNWLDCVFEHLVFGDVIFSINLWINMFED